MTNEQQTQTTSPNNTAVRCALWRAMHVRVDASPHVLEDEIGLRLAAPDDDWHRRPDMDPQFTSGFRAAMVARGRFIEDLVAEQADRGVDQYVILGAGLDTFAQRRPEFADRLRVFEIDEPATQAWKRRRLDEVGYGVPDWLHLVPVDFEASESWLEQLAAAGFDAGRPGSTSTPPPSPPTASTWSGTSSTTDTPSTDRPGLGRASCRGCPLSTPSAPWAGRAAER